MLKVKLLNTAKFCTFFISILNSNYHEERSKSNIHWVYFRYHSWFEFQLCRKGCKYVLMLQHENFPSVLLKLFCRFSRITYEGGIKSFVRSIIKRSFGNSEDWGILITAKHSFRTEIAFLLFFVLVFWLQQSIPSARR